VLGDEERAQILKTAVERYRGWEGEALAPKSPVTRAQFADWLYHQLQEFVFGESSHAMPAQSKSGV
jgi:hypothetical protein